VVKEKFIIQTLPPVEIKKKKNENKYSAQETRKRTSQRKPRKRNNIKKQKFR